EVVQLPDHLRRDVLLAGLELAGPALVTEAGIDRPQNPCQIRLAQPTGQPTGGEPLALRRATVLVKVRAIPLAHWYTSLRSLSGRYMTQQGHIPCLTVVLASGSASPAIPV